MAKEESDRKGILISVALIMFVFLLINQLVSHELYLSSSDYEEVCGEWDTVENYEIITPPDIIAHITSSDNTCFNYCGGYYYWIYDYKREVNVGHYEFSKSKDCYDSCINNRPYIHYYNETVCMYKMIVKK